MSPERNLLFGLLALQNGFITRDQLVAAFGSWTADKSQPLDHILVTQGALSAAIRDSLLVLVTAHLAQHGNDPQQSLAALSSLEEARRALHELPDAELQASLQSLSAASAGLHDPFATTVPQPIPPDDSHASRRFRVLKFHAKGGLGEVYVAKDTELNREVALKEIQPQFADEPFNRSRFVREAEITGGLEHPSIVPVYGLGTYADGRPFYAMKFIRGDSLKEALVNYHQLPDGGSEKSLALRQLLQRFIDICEAMQYAHDRGVLHRDLKPGNIMLGRYGETLVVDWGLAKPLGKNDDSSPESTLVPSSSGSGETLPGRAIGTPAYMSPEQAAGKLDDLGPASDIYSLGATLYHILTGEPPFTGRADDVLPQVIAGKVSPPRGKHAAVPKALEAICLKAMSLKPTDRYPTAKALSADVEHWLADEPVSVLMETVTDKFARVGRKHRGAVTTIVAASLLIAIGSSVAAVVINGQRQANAQLAQEKSNLAETNANLATTAAQNEVLAVERADKLETKTEELAQQLYVAQLARAYGELQAQDHLAAMQTLAGIPMTRRGWEYRYLWRECEGTLLTIRGHTSEVTSVAFCLDGTRLASASYDQTIKLWDAKSGAELLTLRSHTSVVSSVALSPDGTRLASGYLDDTIKLWDTASGAELLTLRGNETSVSSVTFSPDGTRLATASHQTIKLWDAASGAELLTLRGHTSVVSSVTFSPDGTRLATASWDKMLKLWDAASGAELQTLRGHTHEVLSVAFSPDGTRLATASWDNTIKLWDAASGAELLTLRGHTREVSSVAFNPDGTRLASASWDRTVKLWDALSRADLQTLRGHTNAVNFVAFSPDGTRLASASDDQTIKLWDATSGAELLTLRGHTSYVRSVAFSPEGTRLASTSDDQTIKLWDAPSGAELLILRGHTDSVLSVAFSPDGSRLASASWDKTLKLWDTSSGTELQTLRGHTEGVFSVSFSLDGTRLASASEDQTIRLWNASSGPELQTLRGHTQYVTSVAFSRDGTRLVSRDDGGKELVWQVSSGELLNDEPIPKADQLTDQSPNPLIQAMPYGTDILLIRKNPNYDPWKEDAERRRKLSTKWHAEEAAKGEAAGNHYAAAFHLGWLLKDQPDDDALRGPYDAATAKLREAHIMPPKLAK